MLICLHYPGKATAPIFLEKWKFKIRDLKFKIEKYADVFAIIEKAGLKIVYQNRHPVTIGEFDKKVQSLFVNLRALTNDLLKSL